MMNINRYPPRDPAARRAGIARWWLPLLWLAMLLPFAAGPAAAQTVSREYTIKADVIGVLAKCVTWPSGSAPAGGEPLSICVLGGDPFLEHGSNQLDRVAAEARRKGSAIMVKRFNSVKDIRPPCHILFVADGAAENAPGETLDDRLQAAIALAEGGGVLVVGETAGLARRGATANLTFDKANNLIRLEINPDAANRAGLKLAPDLLRLSLVRIVRDPQE